MLNKFLAYLGKKTIDFFQEFGQVSILLVKVVGFFPKIIKSRKLVLKQMEHIGVDSLPLVIIIAIFTGAVAAWQAAYQLKGLAPISFLGTATSRAIITELGPVLTGIIIAGRVGASIAAELGSILASIIMLPVLIVFANTIAILGAYIVSNFFLNVSYAVFFDSVQRFFTMNDFVFGMLKGMIFGGVTSLLGCHIGFRTVGGAEGVGASTIRSFVVSSAAILILDYALWSLVF